MTRSLGHRCVHRLRTLAPLLLIPLGLALSAGPAAAAVAPPIGPGGVVAPVAADLVVSAARVDWNRSVGWHLVMTVKNQGTAAAGPFYTSFNGAVAYLPGLAAGASATTQVPTPGCEMSGTITADAFNQVYELREGNNTKALIQIC